MFFLLLCVSDFAKPRIDCPGDKTLQADQSSRIVTWPSPEATDNSNGVIIVECDPPSGTTFYEGRRAVRCEAIDESDNVDTCRFDVDIMVTGE